MLSKTRSAAKRGAAVIGIAAAALLAVAPSAGAAEEPVPAAGCVLPSLTAIPTSVSPGTSITVSGKNFAGCSAQNVDAAPSATNEVKVGVATDQNKMGTVLGTTTTGADGSFTITVVIPDVPSASDKIALVAAAADQATGLAYAAVLPLQYSGGSATPTAVPAGTGGFGLSDDDSGNMALTVAGGVGLALAGAGALGLRRRKASAHS